MGKGTNRNEIHTALGILTYCIERNAATRFRLILATNNLNSLLRIFNSEIIKIIENMILNGEIEFSLISRIEKYILPLLKSKK